MSSPLQTQMVEYDIDGRPELVTVEVPYLNFCGESLYSKRVRSAPRAERARLREEFLNWYFSNPKANPV